jgi:UDP-2,3-diacylglucosamine pyrophosphatase LpxH
MTKIIVTSDQHLGYEKSNVGDFKDFLDYILEADADVQSLILLGDLVDMWRRDASGLFLAFSEIVSKLLKLSITKKIEVYIVAGNHDYHLLKLQNPGYQFKFYEALPDPASPSFATIIKPATTSDRKYTFKHGWEFDHAQHPLIMEAMCHNLSDEAGNARSSIYHFLEIAKDHLDKELNGIIHAIEAPGDDYVQNLLLPPEKRLGDLFLPDVEKTAYQSVGEGETLIFGHTHRPLVSSDHKLVNTGSWVSDAQPSNTFVEIDGDQIKLCQFKNKDTIIDITNEHIKTI